MRPESNDDMDAASYVGERGRRSCTHLASVFMNDG
jgi:hypothetical protein